MDIVKEAESVSFALLCRLNRAIRLSPLSERKYPDKDAEISDWVVEEDHVGGLAIEPYKEQAQE